MKSKTTYQSYFKLSSNEDCVIWGYGKEKRNSIEVLKKWLTKTPTSKFVVIVPKEEKQSVLNVYTESNYNTENLLLIEINNGQLDEGQLKEFVDYIEHQSCNLEITIDVTGISREHLLILLHLLRTMCTSDINIVYISCEYGDYKVEDYLAPKNNKFFEGAPMLGKPSAMILLAGYETMACKVLINTYQPNKLFIGFSKHPIEDNQNLPERASIDLLMQNYTGKADMVVQEFEYKADDFIETYDSLCNLIKENNLEDNYNIILASCTSKLATIGMYLFHEKYPKAQYVYTSGKQEDISKEILNVFEKKLP